MMLFIQFVQKPRLLCQYSLPHTKVPIIFYQLLCAVESIIIHKCKISFELTYIKLDKHLDYFQFFRYSYCTFP